MLRIGSFTQIFVKNNNANQEMAMPASLPLMAVHDVVTGGCHLFANPKSFKRYTRTMANS